MQIKVLRKWFTDNSTIGELYIGDVFVCFTLEDKVRPSGEKVYGKTAIAAGIYKLIIDLSNRFKRYMPHILNVPDFDGIRIHKGNTDADTLGCILVGTNRALDRIWNCEPAFEKLMNNIGVITGKTPNGVPIWTIKEDTTIEITNVTQ